MSKVNIVGRDDENKEETVHREILHDVTMSPDSGNIGQSRSFTRIMPNAPLCGQEMST